MTETTLLAELQKENRILRQTIQNMLPIVNRLMLSMDEENVVSFAATVVEYPIVTKETQMIQTTEVRNGIIITVCLITVNLFQWHATKGGDYRKGSLNANSPENALDLAFIEAENQFNSKIVEE